MRVVDAGHEEPDRAPEHEHHAAAAGGPDHDEPGGDRPPIHPPTRQRGDRHGREQNPTDEGRPAFVRPGSSRRAGQKGRADRDRAPGRPTGPGRPSPPDPAATKGRPRHATSSDVAASRPRPATGADADVVYHARAVGTKPDAERIRGRDEADQTARVDDAFVQIVVVEGRDVGAASVHRRAGEPCPADIEILPPSRGRGLGPAIVGSILAEAAARGVPATL